MAKNMNLADYRHCFDSLQAIAYKCIDINGIGIRVLGIHYMDHGPDWVVKKHKHTFYEFHYVAEGYTYTVINNTENAIHEGCFYLMPPGTYHSHRQDPQCGHIGFAMRWEFVERSRQVELQEGPGPELSRIKNALSYAHSNPLPDNGIIRDGITRLLEMAGNGCGVLLLQLEFCRLLISIAGCYTDIARTGKQDMNHSFFENKTVENAIRFMEENFSQDISVYDVAGSVHLSYSHLARLFKKHTGKSVIHHLNILRLKKAQRLLKFTDKSIAEIAREVGYNNENYFCTAFKRLCGMTPGSFRSKGSVLAE